MSMNLIAGVLVRIRSQQKVLILTYTYFITGGIAFINFMITILGDVGSQPFMLEMFSFRRSCYNIAVKLWPQKADVL